MNREEIKKILGENASEEMVSNLLNSFHNSEKDNSEKISQLQNQLNGYSDYEEMKTKVSQYENEKLTETEKIQKMREEAEENLRNSRITKNKAKVMTILSSLEIDEDIIDSIVSEDETKSINNANKILNRINTIKESVKQQTEANLVNLDLTPTTSNINPNDKDIMTSEKFSKMSMLEQKQWKDSNPEMYSELFHK
jgi:hypothetical protein